MQAGKLSSLACEACDSGSSVGRDCVVCSEAFTAKRPEQECCSRSCGNKLAHQRRTAGATARRRRSCEMCGEIFVKHSPSAAARRGEHRDGRFCSRRCQFEGQRRYPTRAAAKKAERERWLARHGKTPGPSERLCAQCGAQFSSTTTAVVCSVECRTHRAKERKARVFEASKPQAYPCKECGKSVVAVYGDRRRFFCGAVCARKNARRAGKAMRRAKAMLAGRVERVDPIAVFIRDGWRCHLCGVKTPRSLRGTMGNRAPEVDHIVPLAAGGGHSYTNVACACRRCNIDKGAHPKGQQRLFG